MKGLLIYYSNTGNTKLACEYIKRNLHNIELELVDLKRSKPVDFSAYDLVGFAAWADYAAPSCLINGYLDSLPKQQGKPAFVFNTFGMFNGGTSRLMHNQAAKAGFSVISAFALHTPENIPIVISQNLAWAEAPSDKELAKFNTSIGELDQLCLEIKEGKAVKKRVRFGFLDYLSPFPRTKARKEMGEKLVDQALCTKCGICKKSCPYSAIELSPYPVFDMKKCYGCWACYNRCPQKAIYTKKFRGKWHYPRPNEALTNKLGL
jgi:ferredoxin/flavodoxin